MDQKCHFSWVVGPFNHVKYHGEKTPSTNEERERVPSLWLQSYVKCPLMLNLYNVA